MLWESWYLSYQIFYYFILLTNLSNFKNYCCCFSWKVLCINKVELSTSHKLKCMQTMFIFNNFILLNGTISQIVSLLTKQTNKQRNITNINKLLNGLVYCFCIVFLSWLDCVYNLLFLFVCLFSWWCLLLLFYGVLWHASLQRRLSKCHCMCFSWMQWQ